MENQTELQPHRRKAAGRTEGWASPWGSGDSRQWPSGEDRIPFLFLGSNPKSKFRG